jgi:hypothetical protein
MDTMQAFPLLWKKEPAPDTERSGPVEFAPTNVTAAVAKTGRPASDFVQALCSRQGLEESGMHEDLAKSMSLYFAAFYAFVLETRYARPEQPQLQIEAGRVLPFSSRSVTAEVNSGIAQALATPAVDDAALQSLRKIA